MFACSEDKEIPTVKPPIVNPDSNENPKPVEVDSIYYQLSVDGFELIAATNDSTCLFLQTDTTFAFKCLYDSCGTNRLVAYCDSTGIVERIVIDNQVVNVLHHEDKNKMDIFYKDTEGKIAWIKDVDSPYKNMSSRAEAGDVPYSAISVVSNISYAVYNIINISDIHKVIQPEKYTFINKSSKKETYKMNGTVALKLIMQILGQEYKISASQYLSTVIRVMSDYAKWVQQELYGDAIPALRPYAYAAGNTMSLAAYVTEVDSLKTEFKVGIMATEDGKKLNAYNFQQKKDMEYNPQNMNYPCSFSGLVTGKKYKFRPYLLPVSASKYMKGLKGLLDYYRMNSSFDYRLLETKAQLVSTEDNHAIIKLSVENADISIKMGVIYSEHSDLLEHEHKKIEYEPTFEEGLFSNNFEKDVKLENLKSGYTYFMPYIIYDDNVLNRNLYSVNSIISAVITKEDYTFYGKKDSIININNPITVDAILNKDLLTFKGRFDTDIEKVEEIIEYGIVYDTKNESEIVLENSSILNATTNQSGRFEVVTKIKEEDKHVYYRAYIKLKSGSIYYGEIKSFTKEDDPLKKALIQLYNSTGGDKWTRKDNWCSDKPITEWYGVSFDEYNNLYDISLYDNNLVGKIEQKFPDNVKIILECSNNKLTSINITDCTSLYRLYCCYNQLSSLDVSGCTALKILDCYDNNLSTLNILNCNVLERLFCDSNQLTFLNVSSFSALEDFSISDNPLKELDVSYCTALYSIHLKNIKSTNLKIIAYESIGVLEFSETPELSSLYIISSSLHNLDCAHNQLTFINVSECSSLKILECGNNQLNFLKVSGCAALNMLSCSHNQLTSLDISGTALVRLYCNNNLLTSLNIWDCPSLYHLSCLENKLSGEIGSWVSQFVPFGSFYHDARYEYWSDGSGNINYKDNGVGWWYPGEPENGGHKPN